jgi:hypothetical protein
LIRMNSVAMIATTEESLLVNKALLRLAAIGPGAALTSAAETATAWS